MQAKRPLRKRETFASKVRAARQALADTDPQAETQTGGRSTCSNWRTADNGTSYLTQGNYTAVVYYNESRDAYGLTIKSRQRFGDEEESQAEAERLLDLLESE